ncbi:MAG: DUF3048 domain-containing protein [Candidatus Microsaccharimonas sp.]
MFKRAPKQAIDPLAPKAPNWFKTHKKLSIILGIVLVLLIAGGTAAAFYFINQKPVETISKVKPAPQPEPEPIKYYSPLTGAQLETEAATHQPVTGIMIENSPDARPQSGIKDSGVVFEAIAEGGITRFLVIYQEQKPQLIGPVRSVRMYYVDWVAAFNASVAHIGGSAAALAEVRNGSYRDIDQFFNASSYWRATDRYAPHNVYTSFEKLDALNAKKGYTSSEFTGFTRKDSVAAPTPTVTSIDVQISTPLFNSHYNYDPATNTYTRSQAGAPHLDREGGQISPRVVIAMKVDQKRVFEDGWREQIDAIGTGTAYIFQDGSTQEVTWKKASKTDQITFTDATGKDVPLARGQTWITAVPNGSGSVSWQ